MSRVLGRGPISEEVLRRTKPVPPEGLVSGMDRPTTYYRCGRLYDVGDPQQASLACFLDKAGRRMMENRCIDCANVSVCIDGKMHSEVITPEDRDDFIMAYFKGRPGVEPRLSIYGFTRHPKHQRGACIDCGQLMVWDVDIQRWIDYVGLVKP